MFISILDVSLWIKLLILSAPPFSLPKSRLPTYLLNSHFPSLCCLNSLRMPSVIAVQRSCPADSPTPSPGCLPLLPSTGCFLLKWDIWVWWLRFSHLSKAGLHLPLPWFTHSVGLTVTADGHLPSTCLLRRSPTLEVIHSILWTVVMMLKK